MGILYTIYPYMRDSQYKNRFVRVLYKENVSKILITLLLLIKNT